METKLRVGRASDLYEFRGETLTESVNQEIEECGHEVVVNLASEAYAKVIDFNKVKALVVAVEFRQRRGGKLANVGILSKKARGMMIEFMIRNLVKRSQQLKGFGEGGYRFEDESDGEMVFVRG
jgi:cytoplasmic iron level regulating protein YaaA (DUF328/UPF0246 family)